MRKLLSIIIASFSALFFLTNCQGNYSKSKDSFKDLEVGFTNPSSDYRTAPLAVWNSKVTNAEVERTIQELKDSGIEGCRFWWPFCTSSSRFDYGIYV